MFVGPLLEIRVVNAFRTGGVDCQQLQQATSNPNIQRVLQKQASMSKRISTIEGPSLQLFQQTHQATHGGCAPLPAASTRIKIPEHSYSHTETAV